MSCCSRPTKQEEPKEEHRQGGGCCSAPKKESYEAPRGGCCSTNKEQDHQEKSSGSCCSPEKKKQNVTIHRQMTIGEILGMFPFKAQKLSQEITNAGLHCIGCHSADLETLEMGMISHGKTNEQIDGLVSRLNTLLEEPVNLETITVTPRGAVKFIEIAAEENKQGWGMRFSEELAGCSGFQYVLDFAENAEPDDMVIVSNGIEIYIKTAVFPRLKGSEIDFVDGLRGSGFKISNPNVHASCGCGSSHGY